MLTTMTKLLRVAYRERFAVGAFNIANSEFLKAVIQVAEKENSPVILQIHPNEIDLMGDDFAAYCVQAANRAKVPVVIHLDHGRHINDVVRAIRYGFTSVMIDGSHLPYEENVALTKAAVEIAHAQNISVEGELGTIGNTGSGSEGGADEILYTDPDQANDFVERTQVDTLAVAIGTSHGFYPKSMKPKLQIDRLIQINAKVNLPLVLHGGSDNSEEEIRETTKHGIAKINLSSEMKRAFFNELRKTLNDNPNEYEPDALFPSSTEAAKAIISHKMHLFGSAGKADLYHPSQL
ncbi:ketose-bisphosphate aldolase [Thermobacillus composti KWC4]|uniref:Ketose-bisphosphate aldolase n=1 Tax=Thermobacillus composti (strain DSM 18247 / JCM 13945 / KWC4) TaxID=717605 RepID=L0ECE8_THECK|nr:ketose-bisphosphate aldolase [Thermobacillus composti]AGA57351.1 ketose-bisphosphate aldolase [Thermobacillus composti KWC4]